MKLKITEDGQLLIYRKGKFTETWCPHMHAARCGTWCALFHEPVPGWEVDIPDELELCATTLTGTIEDLRGDQNA